MKTLLVLSVMHSAFLCSHLMAGNVSDTVVQNTNDSGSGSLRAVVAAAPSGATVSFSTNLSGQTILLTNGQVLLNKDVTIDASALPGGIKIDGNRASRIFFVESNATVVLSFLTLTNGYVSGTDNFNGNGGPAFGGGVYNAGVLTVIRSIVVDNSCQGGLGVGSLRTGGAGFGGGIYNAGTLSISGSSVNRNLSGGGSGALDSSAGPAFGGGIYNLGTLTVDDCTFGTNSTTSGTFGNFPSSPRNGSAGGAIYNAGTMIVERTTLNGNSAAGTENFFFALGGSGGAIYSEGIATLKESTLSGNSVLGGSAELAASGWGGGIYNSGTLTIEQSTLNGNSARGGLSSYIPSRRPGSGYGGGIANHGSLTVNESTLAGNSTYSGQTNGTAVGGGIANYGSLTVNESTFSKNSANSGQAGGMGIGGGVYNDSSHSLTLFNSIVAGNSASNSAPDISGTFTSQGNNLTSGDPLLAPLGDYGGPTQTMPPLPGSPAIDSGAATSTALDQRGLPRVVGSAPDLGAVELQPATLLIERTTLSQARVHWTPTNGMLQSAPTINGPWTDMPGSTNGQIINPTSSAARFYRVLQ